MRQHDPRKTPMPIVSRFYGIIIRMFFDEHAPPHFHAFYGDHALVVRIAPFGVLEGRAPARVVALVREWAKSHRDELLDNWERGREHRKLKRIAPLE
jgi:hypothetical protein